MSARQRRFPAPLAPPRFATTAPVCHLEHPSEPGVRWRRGSPSAAPRRLHRDPSTRPPLDLLASPGPTVPLHGKQPSAITCPTPTGGFVHIPRSAFNTQSGRLPRSPSFTAPRHSLLDRRHADRDLDRRLHYRAPAVFMAAVATPISHLYGPLGGGARGGVAGLPSASIT